MLIGKYQKYVRLAGVVDLVVVALRENHKNSHALDLGAAPETRRYHRTLRKKSRETEPTRRIASRLLYVMATQMKQKGGGGKRDTTTIRMIGATIFPKTHG